MKIPTHKRLCPAWLPFQAPFADRGADEVHPAAGKPVGTKKLESRMTPDTKNSQNDRALKNGNAISGAPILSGIRKFPKTPTNRGITTRKTITVACMVTSPLYTWGWMAPASVTNHLGSKLPINGIG